MLHVYDLLWVILYLLWSNLIYCSYVSVLLICLFLAIKSRIIWFAFCLLLFASGIYPWLVVMSSEISSSSTLISSPIVETFVPKTMLGTTVKLNGSNYLLWAQAFRIFIAAQNKLAHLLQSPPAAINPTYVTGLLEKILLWPDSSTV